MSMIGFDLDDEVPTDHRGRPIPPGRRPSRMRGLLAIVVALAVIVGGGIAAYAGLHSLVSTTATAPAAPTDYPGPGKGSVTVVVTAGEIVSQIATSLVSAGVVASVPPFVAAAGATTGGSSIQPATYRLRSHMSAQGALALLLDPASRTGSATVVPEGQRLSVTLATIARTTGLPIAKLRAAAADRKALGVPAWGAGGAEGFLFPATYQFPKGASATTVLRTMVTRFDAAAADVRLVAGARAVGHTPYQVLVVASILEAEVPSPADQAKVARVLYNRLAQGQPLQLDSTVAYVVDAHTVYTSAAQRATSSPYNTYLHPGLPPGPINSPGEQAMQAALHPTPGPWLYFVTVDPATGRTVYSTTVAQQTKATEQLTAWCSAHKGSC